MRKMSFLSCRSSALPLLSHYLLHSSLPPILMQCSFLPLILYPHSFPILFLTACTPSSLTLSCFPFISHSLSHSLFSFFLILFKCWRKENILREFIIFYLKTSVFQTYGINFASSELNQMSAFVKDKF
jgi:hypothetical protein